MKKERSVLQEFKKERLILMETLKSFSFITTLPFSTSTSPHRLLQQLTKKDANTNISHNKYILFDTVFDCILSIFKFDLGMKHKNNVQFEIDRCLKLFDLFEETKMILEEYEYKNLNVYNFIDDASEVLELEKSILQEVESFNETGKTIFEKNLTIVDIATQPSVPKFHYPRKIAMLYCVVFLMEIATDVSIKGIPMKELEKKFLYIGYMMRGLGLAGSMKGKMEVIESL